MACIGQAAAGTIREAALIASNRALVSSALISDGLVRVSENIKDTGIICGGSAVVVAMVLCHFTLPALSLAGGTMFVFLRCREKNTLEPTRREKLLEAATKSAEDILSTRTTSRSITDTNMIEEDNSFCRIKSVKFASEYLMVSDTPPVAGGTESLERSAFFGFLRGWLVIWNHVPGEEKSRFQIERVDDQNFRIKSVAFNMYMIVLEDGTFLFAEQTHANFEDASLLTLERGDATPVYHTQIKSVKWGNYLEQQDGIVLPTSGKRGVKFAPLNRCNESGTWVEIEPCD